MTKTKLPSS